jgi:hypothetical protein
MSVLFVVWVALTAAIGLGLVALNRVGAARQ